MSPWGGIVVVAQAGVCWIDADAKPDQLEKQWHGILTELEPDTPPVLVMQQQGRNVHNELAEAFRARGRTLLVVADNVPEPEERVSPDPLDAFVPGWTWVTLLVTSRRMVDEAQHARVTVTELGNADARTLLTDGLRGHDMTNLEWDVVAAWVGGLPLALDLLNRALTHGLPARRLLNHARTADALEVADAQVHALRGIVHDRTLRGVGAAFMVSYSALPEDARQAARVCAWLAPAHIPASLLNEICALDGTSTHPLLTGRSFLASVGANETWMMHRLLATFLRRAGPRPQDDARVALLAVTAWLCGLDVDDSHARTEGAAATQAALHSAQWVVALTPRGSADAWLPDVVCSLVDKLRQLGERGGDFAAVTTASQIAQDALQKVGSELARCRIQFNLANALSLIGEWRGDESVLEAAIEVYEAVLTVYAQDSMPMDWALTQNNRANALKCLGDLRSDTATLKRAADAYRASLTELLPERDVQKWATTTSNLGTVLQSMSEHCDAGTYLSEAINLYRAALRAVSRQHNALVWAAMQNNLGYALQTLAERNRDDTMLQEALVALRTALVERTLDKAPLEWASTKNNVGLVLLILGPLRGDSEMTLEAIEAFKSALLVWTRERTPLEWAGARRNLGIGFLMLADLRQDVGLAREAVANCQCSLDVYIEYRLVREQEKSRDAIAGACALEAALVSSRVG